MSCSSSVFTRKNKVWPHIIDTTLGRSIVPRRKRILVANDSSAVVVTELSKSGELALLKFPAFKKELLSQSYWSPGDDTGRIKVVISEGFPRDSLTMPLERVKNVVAFSFQHAPLGMFPIGHHPLSCWSCSLVYTSSLSYWTLVKNGRLTTSQMFSRPRALPGLILRCGGSRLQASTRARARSLMLTRPATNRCIRASQARRDGKKHSLSQAVSSAA